MDNNKIKGLKPNYNGKYQQGYFKLNNPDKYMGNPVIIYRSSYELRFMKWADSHPNIIKWNSEDFKIPYINPCAKIVNNKFVQSPANYYIDFFIVIEKNGKRESWFVEVKPGMQIPTSDQISRVSKLMNEENVTDKKIKRYNTELKTLLVNRAKFLAAKKYAEDRGCKFGICDENFLF